jgi:predicted transcriptional regulator
MRYIDQLLNRLELLNLKDVRSMPDYLKERVVQLVDMSELSEEVRGRMVEDVPTAMEMLYEIQDTLMFNPYDEEL